MAINFPTGATLNQIYTYNGLSWQWNGSYWKVYPTTGSYLPINGGTLTGPLYGTIISATTISGGTFYGDGSNLTGVSTGGGAFTGGTVTGATIFTSGLTANTISATTYLNLPIDVRVTGGTYLNKQITFTNNTGGTFSVTGLTNTTNINFGSTGIVVDNTPNAITTGFKGSVTIPYSGTIVSWTILADQVGTVQLDIWNTTYAEYPGSVVNSITGGNYITLTSQSKNTSSILTGWTTTVSPGDILQWNINSASTVNKITVTLNITKN